MAVNFNREQRAELMARAWELHRQEWTVREIAEELGVHHSSVVRWLGTLNARVLDRLEDEVEAEKREQVRELRRIYATAMAAWELSLEDERSESVTSGKAGISMQGKLFVLPDEVTRVRKVKTGNPALLAQALAARSALRELLGLRDQRDGLDEEQVSARDTLHGKITLIVERGGAGTLPEEPVGSGGAGAPVPVGVLGAGQPASAGGELAHVVSPGRTGLREDEDGRGVGESED